MFEMIGTLSAFLGCKRIHIFFYFFFNRYSIDGSHGSISHDNIKIVY